MTETRRSNLDGNRIRTESTRTSAPSLASLPAHALPVTFYLAGEPDLARVERLDPDVDLDDFRIGERSWVAQTYLRLRAAGYPATLSSKVPARGLVVFHAKHKHFLARDIATSRRIYFVAVRADNSSPLLADFEIVQSGHFADERTRFWIPLWPQAGLLRRNPDRGAKLARVAYFGRAENLHSAFRGAEWRDALADLGLEWVFREVSYNRGEPAGADRAKRACGEGVDWEDYRSIDAIVAVRPHEPHLQFAKPASKLINAWRAGVPALIGPEFASRELRRSTEDYFEVASAAEALAVLRRLRDDPLLYARTVAAGARRTHDFDEAVLTQRWARVLFDLSPGRVAEGALPWTRRLPLVLRLPLRRCLRLLRASRSR
ncbi:MAG: hypothetical protein ABI639_08135 [Thermoanaerobaculia bacterium]